MDGEHGMYSLRRQRTYRINHTNSQTVIARASLRACATNSKCYWGIGCVLPTGPDTFIYIDRACGRPRVVCCNSDWEELWSCDITAICNGPDAHLDITEAYGLKVMACVGHIVWLTAFSGRSAQLCDFRVDCTTGVIVKRPHPTRLTLGQGHVSDGEGGWIALSDYDWNTPIGYRPEWGLVYVGGWDYHDGGGLHLELRTRRSPNEKMKRLCGLGQVLAPARYSSLYYGCLGSSRLVAVLRDDRSYYLCEFLLRWTPPRHRLFSRAERRLIRLIYCCRHYSRLEGDRAVGLPLPRELLEQIINWVL